MERFIALLVLAAQVGMAAAVTYLAARRSGSAWQAVRRVAVARGYRDALHRDVTISFLPAGLLPHVGGAVLLGSIGVWPALWAIHRALASGPTSDAPIDLRVLVAAAFAFLLLGVAASALRLFGRRALALGTARSLGGVAIALGALVALPVIAWPNWFGSDAAAAGALGLLTAMAGAMLTRAAGLAQTAELEAWSARPLFDER